MPQKNPDGDQKKILNSKPISKLIWGSASSGKTQTLCWRAKKLLDLDITPIVICFSTHHRFVLKNSLNELEISEKVKVWTFKEWLLLELSSKNDKNITSYMKVISREESLLWLKKHHNKWSGNDNPESDLEIIWHEKLFSPEGQPSDYKDLVLNYQNYLQHHHLVDEVDLYLLFLKKIKTVFTKEQFYFLIDEAQEATILELQLISQLLQQMKAEIFADYDQGVMAWRTPFPPVSIKDFKKLLKVKKVFYLNNNYFNTKQIINSGLKILRKNKNRIAKRIKAISKKNSEVHFYLFESKEEEGVFLANQLQQWLANPLHPEDQIAVLVRNHQQAEEISKFLEGVLDAPYFSHNLLRNPSAQLIFASLRIVLDLASDADYDTVMNSYANPKVKTAYFEIKKDLETHQVYFSSLMRNNFLCQNDLNLLSQFVLIQKICSPTATIDVYIFEKWVNHIKLQTGVVMIEQIEQGDAQITFEQAGEEIWAELKTGKIGAYFVGFYGATFYLIPGLVILKKNQLPKETSDLNSADYEIQELEAMFSQNSASFQIVFDSIHELKKIWNQQNPIDLLPLHSLCNFFEQKDALIDLTKINEIYKKTFLKHLTPTQNLQRFASVFRNSSVATMQNKGRLTLCTIHEGRKMKFQKIWVPRLHQFEFPHALSCSGEELEEERRLFYVALMRAEDTVILSSIKKENSISNFVREAGIMQGTPKSY